jgi:hypothetical protein
MRKTEADRCIAATLHPKVQARRTTIGASPARRAITHRLGAAESLSYFLL